MSLMELTKLQLNAYNEEDKFVFSRFTTVQNLVKTVENAKDYYYRLPVFIDHYHETSQRKEIITHFGIKITSSKGFKMSLQTLIENDLNHFIQSYASMNDEEKKEAKNKDYLEFILMFICRYSQVMNNLSYSTNADVEKSIDAFRRIDNRVIEVHDLNTLSGSKGLYLLILDNYNACYLGQSKDMKKRILQHWRKADGNRIDMFKALDTTRIFALPLTDEEYLRDIDRLEHSILIDIPSNTSINVMSGGKPDWLIENDLDLLKR